jgi:3-oxoacyl-[acyl-carrier-protein] synthase-3
MLCKKLKVSPEKMPVCLDRYGNTSAASIPMVLGDVYGGSADAGLLNVLMSGFGVGLSWGVCSAKIRSCDILPVIESDEIFEEGIINTPEDYYKLNV